MASKPSKSMNKFNGEQTFKSAGPFAVSIEWDFRELGVRTDEYVERVLFRVGNRGKQTMQKVLNVKRAKVSPYRGYKFQPGKLGVVTSGYKSYLRKQRKRSLESAGKAPRLATGLLRKRVEFKVNTTKSLVEVGPTEFASKYVKAAKSIPDLLELGGHARMTSLDSRGKLRWMRVTFRKRPYIARTYKRLEKQIPQILRELKI